VPIRLDANIEFPDDLAAARYAGAEGVGLYRSSSWSPAGSRTSRRDRQYEIYRGHARGMAPGIGDVRTFDVDENSSRRGCRSIRSPPAGSRTRPGQPAGLRGLRLSLTRPTCSGSQLRASAAAARHGQLRIMFPFVSSVEQIRQRAAMIVGRPRATSAAGSRCRACRSAS
jgi:phosphoenolpyruvate-protein kinase (PTS system EI component)